MSDEHTHVWPNSGVGCYCGAKVQCTQKVPNPEPRPTRLGAEKRWYTRCTNAAVSGTHRCAEHGGRAATPTEAA